MNRHKEPNAFLLIECSDNIFQGTLHNIRIVGSNEIICEPFSDKSVEKVDKIKCGEDVYCIFDEDSGYLYMYGSGSTYSFEYGRTNNNNLHNYKIMFIYLH